MQKVHIIGGGTSFHIAPHLALSAPAYGKVVKDLFSIFVDLNFDGLVHCYTTKMAGNRHTIWTMRSGVDDDAPPNLETNEDIAKLLDKLCADPEPKIIFLPAALCDFQVESATSSGSGDGMQSTFGKDTHRWKTGEMIPDGRGKSWPVSHELTLVDAPKIINRVRKERKDIFLVGFKTTASVTQEKQFEQGLTLLKKASCNLVLANDVQTKLNMIITPEQAAHAISKDRRMTLEELVRMATSRAKGHFTRSVVAEGKPIKWSSKAVPESLRIVVDHCIKRGAYKPFQGATVGHFAYKLENNKFVTSIRKKDFNKLDEVGMVLVEAIDNERVISYGGKPSVGGQSQRIIFRDHPDVDCIVHFHCPLKSDTNCDIPVRSQVSHECGSHECGKNTSDGLKSFPIAGHDVLGFPRSPHVKAVMLDKHGPNIVFNRDTDPNLVIAFIEEYWDLTRSTSELPKLGLDRPMDQFLEDPFEDGH